MLQSPDVAFAIRAAQGGLAMLQFGKLAAAKASDPEVKALGQQMIDDYTKANDELTAVAHDENMTLPMTPTAQDQAAYQKFRQLSGAEFDRAYVDRMVKSHQQDIKDFQKEADQGTDPKMKQFASNELPTLQTHFEKLKAIQAKLPSGNSGK